MPYTPPAGSTFLATLRRDLRDTNATTAKQVFSDAQIEDFMNLALAELNIERPVEQATTVGAAPAIALALSLAADSIIDTATAHGFVAGERVRFSALTGGNGLAVGPEYIVHVTSLGAQTFRVTLTEGGDPIVFTTNITAGTVGSAIQALDDLDLPHIWAIEVYNVETRNRNYIEPSDSDSRWLNGWRVYQGKIDLPKGIADIINEGFADTFLTVTVFGYRDRVRWAKANVPDFEDLSDEAAARLYVRLQGFKALSADRSLFLQWQTQTNNTDVSATQLTDMAEVASRDWERMIQRIRRVMRMGY